MPIIGVHQVPSLTQARYEAVVRHLTNGKSRIDSPDDLPFRGLLVHGAGHSSNGFCVIDVFASEEAVRAFQPAVGTYPTGGRHRGTTRLLLGVYVLHRSVS